MEPQIPPFRRFLPAIIWFIVVGVLTLMPGSDVPDVGWLGRIPNFDKVVHAGLFGGLTFFFCLPYFRWKLPYRNKIILFTRIGLASIVWGITVEVIQKYFIPGRGFDWWDWAADICGIILGLWAAMRITKYFTNR